MAKYIPIAASSTDRAFYHSFPRLKRGESAESLATRGLSILKSIDSHGFILAPEIIEWKQEHLDGNVRSIQHLQRRVCFTELSQEEIESHASLFGPFAIRFDTDVMRRAGLVPVIYMPNALEDSSALSSIGTSLVAQLADAQLHFEQLFDLEQSLATSPYATKIFLENQTDGVVEQRFCVPVSAVRDLLSFLTYKMPPFHLMANILAAMGELFYPTDDTHHNNTLSYYRQREWRLIAGLALSGSRLDQELSKEQAESVASVDPQFWNHEYKWRRFPTQPETTSRRVDAATVVSHIGGKRILEAADALFVPDWLVKRTTDLVLELNSKIELAQYPS